ncbi:Inositol-1-monophosphatase [Candidatus Zixiibacteriota bacterium]|nr:Inositol-1-monophosphatase [candidate division Zixibacteria bacterium]
MKKSLTAREIDRYLRFARNLAEEAGRILIRRANRNNEIRYKGRVNLVTAADMASQKYIVRAIEKEYPGHSILAEEAEARERNSEYRWIIDPLDGTTNYAHGFPFYCVSIALEFRGEIMLGVVYDPGRDELFAAGLGRGAYLNGRKIRVTSEAKLAHALLATGFPYDIGVTQEDNLNNYIRFAKGARGIRRAGSAALDLCYVACGRCDGFWELKLSPWDTAAGKLMVEEAGGRVTDFSGKKYSIYNRYIIASNGAIHGQMKSILAKT